MKNRIRSLLILVLGLLLLLFFLEVNPECLIKKIFGFNCPACGLTRAFICLFHLDIIGALSYNILVIPLFIALVISVILLVYDLITNKNLFITLTLKFLEKYYIIIIIVIIICWIIKDLI